MTVLRSGALTDPGMVRVSNQDAILQEATSFAVCDGMGGHAGGEVASAAAVSALRSSLMTTTSAEGLREAIVAANDAVLAAGEGKPELVGMGTTCVAAVLVGTNDGDRLLLANVGDSRGYLFRRGELSQVTEDHSMVAQLIRDGLLDQAEAAFHPQRHVITRVLGLEGSVEVDLFELRLLEGDRVLLCSDGLINELDAEEVTRVLSTQSDPEAAAEDLVRRANANGGADTISVVVIDTLIGDEDVVDLRPTQRRNNSPVEKSGKEGWLARRRRLGAPRLMTVRTFGFAVLLLGVVISGFLFLKWFADSAYYVTSDGQAVVIYQGHPGGVLWFQPHKVETTAVKVDEVLPLRRPTLANKVTEPSLSAAKDYVRNLSEEFQQAAPTTSTTAPSTSHP